MKTTTTISLDQEIKYVSMDIIQNKLKTSLSSYLNDTLWQLVIKYNPKYKIKWDKIKSEREV